jgi:CRISPR/Cas system CMR-associated protein Cmr1 (group 7 of RAMP superfamily)
MAGEETQTGTRDEHYNLISVLYHLLEGAATVGQYIRDAEEAGDQELVQFFKDWQEEQRNFSERAKNLLGSRMSQAGAGAGASGGAGQLEMKDVTNANVKSGGNIKDDIVDEESKESFPASDSPARY